MNFFSLLTILFIGLKLTNYINWSWLIVLSPALITSFITIGIIIYGIITVGISETLKIIKK
jgi:hypothetical protein